VGGETKCWSDHVGLGFSPDSQHVLLFKPESPEQTRRGSLHIAPIAGTRAETPQLIQEGVAPAGAWVE
jgi:hypothetical protein